MMASLAFEMMFRDILLVSEDQMLAADCVQDVEDQATAGLDLMMADALTAVINATHLH
jgi:hypothetical protein